MQLEWARRNLKNPKKRKDIKPDIEFKSSNGSYETVNNYGVVEGGYKAFNYVLYVHNCSTDGYLRHGASETDNYALMLGYVLPSEGYIKYMGAHSSCILIRYIFVSFPGSAF
ncbi:MAG: hypothetical protein B1H11_02410 [Desulfobacteraceae bacterium 4484_190.1]|nr:MAG: hypothetical protein B1H11_02410 [Desulfobacteraceae bacterium 4484_190.1]